MQCKCKQAGIMMSERLDGLLDSTEIALLEDHLEKCSACREEWCKLQALDQLLLAAPMAEPPIHLRAHVMTRLERRQKARRAIIGATALTLGTVTLALLIVAPLLLGLLNATGIAPLAIQAGPEIIRQILAFVGTMGRAFLVVLEILAIPLAVVIFLGIVIAATLNGLWIGTLRRLRVTH